MNEYHKTTTDEHVLWVIRLYVICFMSTTYIIPKHPSYFFIINLGKWDLEKGECWDFSYHFPHFSGYVLSLPNILVTHPKISGPLYNLSVLSSLLTQYSVGTLVCIRNTWNLVWGLPSCVESLILQGERPKYLCFY